MKKYLFIAVPLLATISVWAFILLQPQPSVPAVAPPVSSRVKITLAGDFMLHTPFTRAAKTGDNTYDFTQYLGEIKPYIDGDLNITDIEGPVDSFGGNKNISSYPTFNYPIELLDGLKFAGFNFVITANNHAYDKGWQGLLAMREKLASKGLEYLGTYATPEEYATPYIKEINGIKIGISAWSALDNGISFMVAGHEDYAMKKFNQDKLDDIPRMLADIQALRDAGAEIVLMPLHWGAEYKDAPTDVQKQIAKLLTKGGADIIVGDHPHCVQPIEVHENNGKKSIVIYSLGNFFADQLAMETPIPKTQYGMLVSVELIKGDSGEIEMSANYMPTLCYREPLAPHNPASKHGYAFFPAGKYLTEQPEHLSTKTWQESKNAWAHVRRVVGDAIPAYDGITNQI